MNSPQVSVGFSPIFCFVFLGRATCRGYQRLGKARKTIEVLGSVSLGVSKNGGQPEISSSTLPETNIAPENKPSQEESSIPTIHFQGLC